MKSKNPIGAPATRLQAEIRKAKQNKLTNRFLFLWRALNGPALVAEHRFHDTRKWRFDFCSPTCRVAIELEGGVWKDGAHTRGKHYTSDCEKYNAAAMAGWCVLRFPTDMVSRKYLAPVVQWLNRMHGELREGKIRWLEQNGKVVELHGKPGAVVALPKGAQLV